MCAASEVSSAPWVEANRGAMVMAHTRVCVFLRARALVLARVLGWMDWRQRVLAEQNTSRYGAKLTTNYSATLGLITAVNIIIVSS